MSTSIDVVIAELIEQRRAKETEIRHIDEALLALQPFTRGAMKLTRGAMKRKGSRNLTPEQREQWSARMKATWAKRKAAGLTMGRYAHVAVDAQQLVGA